MAQVIRNVMASSVEFSQGNRKVLIGKNNLPLVSAAISAVCDRPLVAFGVRSSKLFQSAANSQGYRGADKILDCAKDTLTFAAGKGLLVKDGASYGINGEFRDLAENIVDFVSNSEEFKQKEAKVSNTKGKVGRPAGKQTATAKAKDIKKFRIDEDGSLVRLTRGKPSPFWTIVLADDSADGSKAYGDDGEIRKDLKVVQTAAEREDKPAKAKAKSGEPKTPKAKGISTDELAALVNAQVAEVTKDLTVKIDALTELVKSLSSKLDSLQAPKPLKAKAKAADSENALTDAKLEAMADLRQISEEYGVICTTL